MSCKDYIREKDAYGQVVALRHQGERTINTEVGGLVTILLRLCMFAFIAETCIDFFNGSMDESSIIRSDTREDFYPLNFQKFMTGYKMRHVYTKTNPVTEQ